MTQLYLIRHTQAEGNLYRMMQGHWDGGVTPLGAMENNLLAERFKDIPLAAAYSSDLRRAMLTAEATVRGKGIPVRTDIRLRELDLGPWETQFFGNITYEYPDEVDKFLHRPGDWHIDGAETVYDVEKRALAALTDIAEAHSGQSVAIASHGITIRSMLAGILHLSYTGSELLPIFKNTSVTSLRYENGSFTVEWMDDTSHLDGLTLSDWMTTGALRDEPFDPADDPALYTACYRDTWNLSCGNLEGYNEDLCLQAACRRSRLRPDSVRRFFLGDQFAGLLDLDILRGAGKGYGWISLLYLAEEFRRKGYGVQLLARAIVLYRRLGMNSIRLQVSDGNGAALKFYKRNGFHVLSSSPGAAGISLLMEKSLGEYYVF